MWGEDAAFDYLKKLHKNVSQYVRSGAAPIKATARGETAIGIVFLHDVAQEKARTAVAFRRPSKAFQDMVAGGGEGLRTLRLPGALPIEGGLPLIIGGKIVGAIGVSGVTSAQDGQIAAAGVAVTK